MRHSRLIFSIFGLILPLFFASDVLAQQKFIQIPTAFHISSDISDGKLSLEEIAQIAQKNNIKSVILGDHLIVKVDYGIWPLRRFLKKSLERKSIFKYGIKNYLDEINRLQKKYPDVILIPGAEVTTFYYWTGNPFKNTLKLNNWHKHILVAGLFKEEDYSNLPILGAKYKNLGNFNPTLLWPLALILIGPLFFRIRTHNYQDLLGKSWGPYSKSWKFFGKFLIFIGILMFINNFPFRDPLYDPYSVTSSIGPYQKLIDYVNEKGGMTFWAHPEMRNNTHTSNIQTITHPYPQDLYRARDYTGYAILYEGYKEIGRPGGIWDKLLDEFCNKERAAPVWAIGELDFEASGSFQDSFHDLSTVLLSESLTQKGIMEALKDGKMYIIRGQAPYIPVLDSFTITGEFQEGSGTIGDIVRLKSKPVINIKAHVDNDQEVPIESVKVRLIRNGEVIKVFDTPCPVDIEFMDSYSVGGMKIYYRIEMDFPKKRLITNPIFVRFKF